jgi:competence ComEA-like helix-hairpin-helix protein
LFVGTLLSVAVALVFVHWLRLSDWGRQTVEVDRLPAGQYQYSVDINEATWVEWAQFDGIGETLAKRIVAHRQAHGRFEDIDDLRRVKGIGPKKLAEIRPYLTMEAAEATAGK